MSEVKVYSLNVNNLLEHEGDIEDGFVRYSDVERALKLWEIVKQVIPIGKKCISCYFKDNEDGWCILFDKQLEKEKTAECIDIFGGEV